MLRFLRKRLPRAAPARFDAPISAPGLIYAVGDVHGRHDLLERLIERIAEDAAAFAEKPCIVFLGDYIDRGDGARETLDMLMALSANPDVETVFLMGNHEQMMLGFLRDPDSAARWLRFGGRETLMSYGIRGAADLGRRGAAAGVRAELAEALGPHLGFVEGLRLCHRAGNLFFAHAGADPANPVDEQEVQALLWGCKAFATKPRDDGIWVVHGHVVVDRPGAAGGRISVDTGAYFSGRLTAARIFGGEVSFIES